MSGWIMCLAGNTADLHSGESVFDPRQARVS